MWRSRRSTGRDDRGRCLLFQAEDGIRDLTVTGVQTCALPISKSAPDGYTMMMVAPSFVVAPVMQPAPYHPLKDLTGVRDRKSTRLNSSHSQISYAVFCLKKKKHSN